MSRTFTASRVSENNVLFPPTVEMNDEGVLIIIPHLLKKETVFIPYNAVSAVHLSTPIVGFSTVSFYAYGKEFKAHGFLKGEVQEMKRIVEQNRG